MGEMKLKKLYLSKEMLAELKGGLIENDPEKLEAIDYNAARKCRCRKSKGINVETDEDKSEETYSCTDYNSTKGCSCNTYESNLNAARHCKC